jgi:acyl-homoserine-lactone acylase
MRRLLVGLFVVAGVAAGAVSAAAAHRTAARRAASALSAVIRRTEHGIPHIEASNWAGLGYGFGYVFAQDNICTMAEDYVTVDAQRSRYFGPTGSYEQYGNGVTVSNLDSDFFWQQIIDSGVINHLLSLPPPLGLEPQAKQAVAGYVAGYNRYLRDVGGTDGISDPTCRGKPWVHPITLDDAYLRFYQLVELASGDVAIPGIAEAQPPTPAVGLPSPPPLNVPATAHALASRLSVHDEGSNAVAVGRDGTRNHRGLLLGNPHFPWQGTERFYQFQATIPGQVNVEGATLFGVPAVLIGHTATMAWSHTVSTAFRFTPFQLTLVPGSPTTFLRDGRPVAMTSRTVTVQVPDGQGGLKPVSRTLWTAPGYGPIFNSLEGIPLPWTPTTAFALGDAEADNFRVFNHFFDVDRATSTAQVLAILKKYEGIPWVNTIAADKQGNALYADIGAIPNVSNAKAQECDTALGAATFADIGLPILDGSRSACDWGTDSDAVEPGLFGPSHLPYLLRTDYVTNSNDSYWLSNPHHPLTGFARIIGDEGTARSLRTRIGLIMTQARIDGTDGLGPSGFTRQDMQNMVFSDIQYGGVLVRNDLVSMCRSLPGGLAPTTTGAPVPVGDACNILADWDLHENLNSKGAILFRRFWDRAVNAEPTPWSHPFDASDPVHTPYGLDTNNPQVRTALGDAINDLNAAHIPLDAAPGQVQFATRNGQKIPLHGGPGDPNGEFNAIYNNWIPGQGLSDPYLGSSYVQVVSFNNSKCPDTRTILTYSLSTNPRSPFYADQTRMFSAKQWVTERFCQADVLAHTQSTTILNSGAPTRTVLAHRSRRRPRRPVHHAPAATFTG